MRQRECRKETLHTRTNSRRVNAVDDVCMGYIYPFIQWLHSVSRVGWVGICEDGRINVKSSGLKSAVWASVSFFGRMARCEEEIKLANPLECVRVCGATCLLIDGE